MHNKRANSQNVKIGAPKIIVLHVGIKPILNGLLHFCLNNKRNSNLRADNKQQGKKIETVATFISNKKFLPCEIPSTCWLIFFCSQQQTKKMTLSRLFSYAHISPRTTTLQYLLLACYFPIGICLLLWRLFALVWLSLFIFIAPFQMPVWLVQILAPIFGIVSRFSNKPKIITNNTDAITLLACNHRTAFDVFPFLTVQHISVLIDKGFFETSILVKPFQKLINALPLDRTISKEQMRTNIVTRLQQSLDMPLLWFPEGWDTNGAFGLMVYQKFLFSLPKTQIQPVALRVSIPLLPFIEPGILGSSITREFCWLFFVPFMLFDVHYLPICAREQGEDAQSFAQRVQQVTALQLGIQATQYTNKDALALRQDIMKNGSIPDILKKQE